MLRRRPAFHFLLIFLLLFSTPHLRGEEEGEDYFYDVENTAVIADEGVSISMIGWGIALAIGIIILAATLGSNDNSNAHQ